ncbi:DUF3806 domain-containing protein [Planctomycetes bacterium TBK1r]|uniref:DUF3806 domain-containing protein n=1 Tax=Stieleria magnilauensis TaxID=2527963 RepID=A0ABX5Y671_9BACT|nr:hypothetical protein TBK1r_66400 [Planctomycetes bacterium TBK1r]
MKPKFSQPNQAEQEWIAKSIAHARSLIAASDPDGDACDMTPGVLDVAYRQWLTNGTDINEQANDVVHAIGFAFGQFLVDNDEFEWTLVTDQFGTDLGVRALPSMGDVLVCPASMVAKRWETKETDFLVPMYRAVIDQRDSVRKSWESKETKPWWKPW